MYKKYRMTNRFVVLLLAFCMSALLVKAGFSAQSGQQDNLRSPAQVSAGEVRVRTIDWDAYQAKALAAQQDSDISWVHGSSLHLEVEESPFTLTHLGFGSDVTIIQAPANTGNWVHLAIPTTPFILGTQARLNRVIIAFDSPPSAQTPPGAFIDRVDVWDGGNRLLAMPVSWGFAGFEVKSVEFSQPPSIFTAVGISIHIVNCSTPEFCSTRTIRFVGAGAAFAR